LHVGVQYPQKIETVEVADFFVEFLKSLEEGVLSPEDPRLLKTDENEDRLTISSVHDSARLIKEVTIDPEASIFNLQKKQLNLIYVTADWAKRTPVWDDTHLHVIQNYTRRGLVRRVYDATRKKLMKKSNYKRFPPERPFNDWRDDVVCWWNDFVENGYTTKMPQLYLYGRSNVGKTSFIQQLLG
jgi:hypothetical protein